MGFYQLPLRISTAVPGRRLVRGGLEISLGRAVMYTGATGLSESPTAARLRCIISIQRNPAQQIYKCQNKMDHTRSEGHHHPPFLSGGDAQRHQRRSSSVLGQSRHLWDARGPAGRKSGPHRRTFIMRRKFFTSGNSPGACRRDRTHPYLRGASSTKKGMDDALLCARVRASSIKKSMIPRCATCSLFQHSSSRSLGDPRSVGSRRRRLNP